MANMDAENTIKSSIEEFENSFTINTDVLYCDRFLASKIPKPLVKPDGGLIIKIDKSISDSILILDVWKDEFELFRVYYNNLIETDLLRAVLKEYDNLYTNDIPCNLSGESEITNQRPISCYFVEPQLKGGRHSKFEELSKCVKLTGNFLHHDTKLIAKEDLKVGDVLIKEQATFIAKAPNCKCINNRNNECFHCWKPLTAFVVCKTCQVAIYCSAECRDLDRNEFHFWECRGLRMHFFMPFDISRLALQMVVYGAHCHFQYEGRKCDGHKITSKRQKLYTKLMQLESPLKKMSKEGVWDIVRKSTHILMYLIENDLFYWLTINNVLPEKTLFEKYLFVGGLLVRHMAQCCKYTQFFPWEDPSFIVEEQMPTLRTPALCLILTMLGKDCNPNCAIVVRRNKCIIKAVKNIKTDELLTVSYFGLDTYQTYAEKKQYFNIHYLECTCASCTSSKKIEYDGQTMRCPKCYSYLTHRKIDWRCRKCGIVKRSSLQLGMAYLESLSADIMDDSQSYEVVHLQCYVDQYKRLFKTYNLRYFCHFTQLMKRHLLLGNFVHFMDLGMQFLDELKETFHPYSEKMVELEVDMMNSILIYLKLFGLNCKCDNQFYECLKSVNRKDSKILGNIYFNALGQQCFKKEYPIKRCDKYVYFPPSTSLSIILDALLVHSRTACEFLELQNQWGQIDFLRVKKPELCLEVGTYDKLLNYAFNGPPKYKKRVVKITDEVKNEPIYMAVILLTLFSYENANRFKEMVK